MNASRRRLDPYAALLGLVTIGVTWAVGIPFLPGLAISGLTTFVASAGVILQRRRLSLAPPSGEAGGQAPLRLHADEERWIRRGDDAVSAIDRSVRWVEGGALKESLSKVAVRACSILEDLRTLAAQVAATRLAGRQLDASRLSSDLTRLTAKLEQSAGPDVEEDLRRSVEAVREQLRVHRRLESARRVLQARIQSGALGLQQLAAQVSEMTALASPDTSMQQGQRIDDLNTQLEALRAGLSDAGALSRRALGGIDPEGGDHVPTIP